MQIKKETIFRTVITFVALINSILIIIGKNPLPFSENEIFEGMSAILSAVTTFWSWWKNNSYSYEALLADEYLRDLKTSAFKMERTD